jgi:integrase
VTAKVSDFHFHDLRRTTASMLATQGASLLEIADVLGHKTLAMVKRYSHLIVDHKATVIDRLIAARAFEFSRSVVRYHSRLRERCSPVRELP